MADLLATLIQSPPLWMGLILLVALVSFMIREVLHVLRIASGSPIPFLEAFATVVLGLIVIHGIYEAVLKPSSESNSFYLILAFIGFTLLSGILYIIDKRFTDPPSRQGRQDEDQKSNVA
jgi:hypothetical protein